jgi:hypothetical protein
MSGIVDGREPNAHPATPGAGFPRSWFHPVHGERVVGSIEDEHALPGLATDWFSTAARADAARTQPEADLVALKHGTSQLAEHAEGGVVRQSVSAQRAFDTSLGGPAALPNPAMPEVDPRTGTPKAPEPLAGGAAAPEAADEPAIKS